MTTLFSVSSWVARGHVGNSAIEFPLMRRGHEVVALPTIVLAHHLGHSREVVRNVTPDIQAIGHDILNSPVPHPVDGVLVGFLATGAQAVAVAGLIAEARAYKPGIPTLIDPVAGDDGALYVDPAVVGEIKSVLLPMADLVTPNVTELVALTDPKRIKTALDVPEDEIVGMARDLGPPVVVVTSADISEMGRLANVIVTEETVVRVETPFVDVDVHGTGDMLAGLILGEIVSGAEAVSAVATAAAIVHDVLSVTAELGRDELALVAAQKFIVTPRTTAEVAML